MKLIEAIEKLKKSVGIPPSIAEIMGAEKKEVWLNNVDSILLIVIFKFHLSAVLLSLHDCFIQFIHRIVLCENSCILRQLKKLRTRPSMISAQAQTHVIPSSRTCPRWSILNDVKHKGLYHIPKTFWRRFLLSSFPYPVCFVLKCKHAWMHSSWHSSVSVYYHTTDATVHSDSERRMVWTPDQALVNSCKSVRSPTLSCCWSFPTKMTVSDANHIDILKMFLCTSEWNEDHLVSIWVVCSSSELKIQNSTAQCNGQRGPEISYFLR